MKGKKFWEREEIHSKDESTHLRFSAESGGGGEPNQV